MKYDAERPQIGPGVADGPAPLLGREVRDGAERGARGRERGVAAGAGEPEVHDHRRTVLAQHHIARPQVAVKHIAVVRMSERLGAAERESE
jgi:hypothetical protein